MALLTRDAMQKVIELLVAEGLVDPDDLNRVQNEVAQTRQPLMEALTTQRIVNDDMLAHATAVMLNIPYVNLRNVEMPQSTLSLLPLEVAARIMAVPLGEANGQLAVAMLDTGNIQSIDYLATYTGKSIRTMMSSGEGVQSVLRQYRGDFSGVTQAVKATNREIAMAQTSSDIKTITQDSPISKALTSILEFAVKSKASDVHIEPLSNSLIIRCRIDGVLRRVMELPKSIEPALVSRIKILANLKIDEHRIPQDGQFAVLIAEKEVDLRIAISPVVWGEQVEIGRAHV